MVERINVNRFCCKIIIMNLELTNSQVLIIGGTKGIGLSIAKNFLSEGAIVHIISRNSNNELKSELEKKYPSCVYFYQSDATIEESLIFSYNNMITSQSLSVFTSRLNCVISSL